MRERTVIGPSSAVSAAGRNPIRARPTSAAAAAACLSLRRVPIVMHHPFAVLPVAEVAHAAILDADVAVGEINHLLVVGGEDERRGELPVQHPHELEDALAGLVVEIR